MFDMCINSYRGTRLMDFNNLKPFIIKIFDPYRNIPRECPGNNVFFSPGASQW